MPFQFSPLRPTRLCSSLFFAFVLLAVTSPVHSIPIIDTRDNSNGGNGNISTYPPPHFVLYGDQYVEGTQGPPDVSEIQGFNTFALSFLCTTGPADKVLEYSQLSDPERAAIHTNYQNAGISLIVSLFGATETPTTSGVDPVVTAQWMAGWVQWVGVDGVDVDYEDLDAMNKGDGSAEDWLATFTRTLRETLPQGQYILTHAPLAPWFSTDPLYASGAYLTVDKTVGDLIDWYNVQFYNQGPTEYTDCPGLLLSSSSTFPNSSLFEISNSGVPLDKLVIGKPASYGDADSGGMDAFELAGCVGWAMEMGWKAGVMFWEFPHANASFIQTVRGTSFPL